MMPFAAKLTTTRLVRCSSARWARASRTLIAVVCKLAILLATFEPTVQVSESLSELAETPAVETAHFSRGIFSEEESCIAKGLAVQSFSRAIGATGNLSERAAFCARAAGHRLANGLCAPLKC